MRKIIFFIALMWFSAVSFAAVSITVSPSSVNFGEVSIYGKADVEDSVTLHVSWSGVPLYSQIESEVLEDPAEGCIFWLDPSYKYTGSDTEWDPIIYEYDFPLHFYADEVGTYSCKIGFYSYEDDYGTVESERTFVNVSVTVTDAEPVVPTTSFERINSTSELKAGDIVVFVNEATGAVGGPLNDTYLPAVTENVTIDVAAGTAEIPATAQMFTMNTYSGNWQFTTTDSGQRLHLDVTGKGAFTFEDTKAGEILAGWGIEISGGEAIVSRPDDEQTFPVLFNGDRFKPYKNTIDYVHQEVALYKKVQSATGLEQTAAKEEIRKEMRDGRLVIIRNGETYSAEGKRL